MLIVGCCHSFVGVIAKLKEGAENVQTKLQAKVEGVGFKPINPETASRGDSLWYLWLVLFLTLFRLAVLAVYFLLVLPISCFLIFFRIWFFYFKKALKILMTRFTHFILHFYHHLLFIRTHPLLFIICYYVLCCVFVCRLFHTALFLFFCVCIFHI